jgi:hypothetical protein
VVATDFSFHTFIPTLDSNNLPTLVRRYQSSDGVNWTGPSSIGMESFGEPLNETPGSPPTVLYYAPLLVASGYTNGRWSVAFQAKNGNFNNVVLCTSDWGCIFPNAATDDEFLVGTSVSGDNAYWTAYLTYSTLDTRQLPLISQAIYFPAGQPAVGATTYPNIDPTGWTTTLPRCPDAPGCHAAGDFATIASNPFASASTPFISRSSDPNRSSHPNDLFQSFVQDPPAPANVPNFKPNVIRIPYGSDIRSLGTPNPPGMRGINPARRHDNEPRKP